MKLEIKDYCIRCQFCVDLYPELFASDEENDVVLVKVDEVPEDMIEMAKKAIGECAVTAIHAKKE